MADTVEQRGARRRIVWIASVGLVVLLVLVVLAMLRPLAPRRVTILTGPPESPYHGMGRGLADELGRHGVTAQVVETRGALDNLERLIHADATTVALAPTGIERSLDDAAAANGLVSLGSIAFEPLWVFVREDLELDRLTDLRGRSVAVGAVGSTSREVATVLLKANGIEDEVTLVPYASLVGATTSDALQSREIDAILLVGRVRDTRVADLLRDAHVRCVPIARADTYAARFPELARFDVLPGAVDLAHDIPPEKLAALAAATNVVAPADVHGALVEVLIESLRDVLTRPSLESPAGVFPSMQHTSLPLDPRARRLYQDGPSQLSNWLPYWARAIVDQIVFVLVPALAVLLTFLKVVPSFLGLRYALRSFSEMRKLAGIERDSASGKDPTALGEALDAVDRRTAGMHVPPPKASSYLELRQCIHDTRERILARQEGTSPATQTRG